MAVRSELTSSIMRTILISMTFRTALVALAMAVALVGSGCSSSSPSSPSAAGKLTIVASFFPLEQLVKGVADPSWKLTTLTAAGVEPHDLELRPSQVVAIDQADLVVYLGDGFQPALEDALKQRTGPKLDLLAGRKDLHRLGVEAQSGPASAETVDPHIWLDPVRYASLIAPTVSALASLDRSASSRIAQRGAAFRASVLALDGNYASGLRKCASRTLVTGHAAFGYMAERYQLTQHAVSGLSPDTEPGPDRLAEIASIVKREHVTTVFTETLVPPDLAETLARETGATAAVLNPLEGVTSRQARAAVSYISLMHDNLDALRTGLRCA